jgi:hypothetical protein
MEALLVELIQSNQQLEETGQQPKLLKNMPMSSQTQLFSLRRRY